VPARGAVPVAAPVAAAAAVPPESMRRALSISAALVYLSGNTPTDMPRRRLTSKVLTRSSQPSASARVPRMMSTLRRLSTRTMASEATMGCRILAISPAPRYSSGMMMVP
jgi:hypothetical protein